MRKMLLLLAMTACHTKDLPDTGTLDSEPVVPADADNDGYDEESDCDDQNPAVYPDAAELCDAVDNNCDGAVDEGLDSTWYTDSDGDGWGDSNSSVLACAQPSGAVAQGGDCADEDPAYYPGASEDDCTDPNDYNCDGSVGYADEDGDGFAACLECDDGDAAIRPDATEVCDGVDNNCDGDIDEGVTSTFYVDSDGDGFGDLAYPTQACSEPEGYSADASDCDDDDGAVNPDASELCDGIDNNCDNTTDEDSAIDAATWYADLDADGFGDAANTTLACTVPTSYLSDSSDCDDSDPDTWPGSAPLDDSAACMRDGDHDDYGDDSASGAVTAGSDCDDADATVYPAADEDGGDGSQAGDGLDNDCDGYEDEGLLFGSGADGSLSLSADASWEDIGGACTAVSALGSSSATVADASAFALGDKAMLINLQGSSSSSSSLGAWELLDVSAVSGSTVSFLTPLTGTYGVGGNSTLTGQDIALLRVPQLQSLKIASGVTLSAEAWSGSCGGVLALLVSDTATIDGAVSADAAGYAGGAQNTSYQTTGQSGESYAGTGSKTYLANKGGGGGGGLSTSSCTNCEGTGGGGGHGATGDAGEQSNPSLGYGGVGGSSYGDSNLLALTLGSGGGAGALDAASEGGIGGSGGAGGGVLLFFASSLTLTGTLSADGEDGEVGCAETTNWCGTASLGPSEAEPGGGGAGGAVYVVANTLSAAADSILAEGGAGQLSGSSWKKTSGDGAVGRVRVDFSTLNSYTHGSSGATTEAAAVCEPDPGSSSTP